LARGTHSREGARAERDVGVSDQADHAIVIDAVRQFVDSGDEAIDVDAVDWDVVSR